MDEMHARTLVAHVNGGTLRVGCGAQPLPTTAGEPAAMKTPMAPPVGHCVRTSVVVHVPGARLALAHPATVVHGAAA
jgi:hypothetical protein